MQWTREAKLAYLVRVPWTVKTERDPDEGYVIIRVAELPSVIATGNTDDELEKDFWESLQATLESALEFGDPLVLPAGMKAPWDQPAPATPLRNVIFEGEQPGAFSVPSGGPRTGMPAMVKVNRAAQKLVAA